MTSKSNSSSRQSSSASSSILARPVTVDMSRRDEHAEGNLKVIHCCEVHCDVMCVRFSNDGMHVAVGLSDGIIKIFSAENGLCLYNLAVEPHQQAHQPSLPSVPGLTLTRLPVTSLSFLPANVGRADSRSMLLATYASGMVRLWHYTTGKCLLTTREERATLVANMNPYASLFLTGGSDVSIRQYDLETGAQLRTFQPSDNDQRLDGHRARVFAIQHHPTQIHVFASGGWDDTVQVWDDRQSQAVRYIYGPHVCGDGIDIDGTREQLLTASWRKDCGLQIWDFPSGQRLRDVVQDPTRSSLLYCAQWVAKDFIVCGGSDQNMLRLIDRASCNTLGQFVELPQGVYSIDNDRVVPKPRLAVASGKCIYVMKMDRK